MGKKFGENLKQLRECNSLTQRELAEDLSVTAKTVSKWENGFFEPDMLMLEKIADYFNVTPNELFGFSALNKKASAEQSLSTEINELIETIQVLNLNSNEILRLTAYAQGMKANINIPKGAKKA